MKPFPIRLIVVLVCIILLGIVSWFNWPLKNDFNKTIWLYWDKVEMPPLLEDIKTYNKIRLSGWNVKYLNENTIHFYIPLWAYPRRYKDLIPAHKADWIRLYLLYNYGGLWLDSSIILNKAEALMEIYDRSVSIGSQLTVFQTEKNNKVTVHTSGLEVPLVIDNWFIMAPTGSIIIKMWLEEFTRAIDMGLLAYKHMAIAEGTDISSIHFSGDEDVYLTQHICIQYVLQVRTVLDPLPPMLFLNSYDSMLRTSRECKFVSTCIQDKINKDHETQQLPYIKIIGYNRDINISKFLRARS